MTKPFFSEALKKQAIDKAQELIASGGTSAEICFDTGGCPLMISSDANDVAGAQEVEVDGVIFFVGLSIRSLEK